MLRTASTIERATVQATDGPAGTVDQILFDDTTWEVTYLSVRVGDWLTGHEVLVSPAAVTWSSPTARTLYVEQTRQQIWTAPDITSDPPVSQQQLMKGLEYAGYPQAWYEPGLHGGGWYALPPVETLMNRSAGRGNPRLRGSGHVCGYGVIARDAVFGRMTDLVLDDVSWTITHAVVRTSAWWWSKQVLIAARDVRGFDWADGMVTIDMWREDIQRSPEHRPYLRTQHAPQ